MELVVKCGKSEFDGNVIALVEELKTNGEFAKLWNNAESSFDDDGTLDFISVCILDFLDFAMECEYKPTKQETVDWLIEYLG
nr:MAG TPA: hypothetical protein [Caudoviricetes sp.]